MTSRTPSTFPRRYAATQRFTLGAPRTISVSRDGQRVVFCRSTAGDDPINRLWVLDLAEGADSPPAERLVADPTSLGADPREMTEAEKARRERAREAGGGIVSYALDPTTTRALWVQGGELLCTDLDAGRTTTFAGSGQAYGPRWSPDGEMVAYVSGSELRLTGSDGDRLLLGPAADQSLAPEQSLAPSESPASDESLTPDESPAPHETTVAAESTASDESPAPDDSTVAAESTVTAGSTASHDSTVAAESPASHESPAADNSTASHDNTLAAESTVSWGSAEFVAAEEMGRSRGFWWSPASDRLLVTRVDTAPVPEWWIANPIHPWEAPRNVRYPAAGSDNAEVGLHIATLEGQTTEIDWTQGEFEYLARASWTTSNGITLTVQTRDQRTLAVLSVDPDTAQVTELARQTDAAWIDLLSGVPTWAGDQLVLGTIHPDDQDTVTLQAGAQILGEAGFQVRSLIRAADDHLLVTGSHEPTELHVARLPLDGGPPELLTHEQGVHRAAVGGYGQDETLVISAAGLDQFGSTVTCVRPHGQAAAGHAGQGEGSSGVDEIPLASFSEMPDLTPTPVLRSAGPTELRSAVLLPDDHDGSPLPVLMDPYGGPHAQRVLAARNGHLTSQWFANQGFAVVVTDGRGTPGRGAVWERAVHHDLAAPVLDDQVTALTALADEFPLDLDKVGIRGWSFGGYLAALAVLRRPDIFHAAIAGAPVTDWRLYDTHYTERYLGNPSTDDGPYAENDLCADAPNLTRPLLLVHGLVDDNVVVAHTLVLSQALLEAGRAHEVLPLSGVSHMTPQEEVAENLLLLQLAFLRRSLGLEAPS